MLLCALLSLGASAQPLRWGSEHTFFEPSIAAQVRATALDDSAPHVTGELRRLRVVGRGTVADGLGRFAAQLNFTPAALELLDLWAEFAPARWFQLRVGLFKTPYTRHRQLSFGQLPLVDWDLASVAFGAERQRGVQWSGSLELSPVRLHAALGAFTGDNARAGFARGLADAWGVRLVNPSDFRTWSWGTVHPELVGRVTVESPALDARQEQDPSGGELLASGSLSAAWDSGPRPHVDFAARLAGELLLTWRRWSLVSIVHVGWERAPALIGGTCELTRALEGVELSVRWSGVGRLSRAPASVPFVHELVAGVRAPLGARWLVAQADAGWVGTEPGPGVRLRLQLSLLL